jgi:hypothetical protein
LLSGISVTGHNDRRIQSRPLVLTRTIAANSAIHIVSEVEIMLRKILSGSAAVALIVSFASAQLIVGNDQSGVATIYDVHPVTGVATPLYSSSTSEAKPWGMAFDPDTLTLYWNNGSTLYRSPLQNPLVPQNLGTMTFNQATVNFVALGFHNGQLYGTRNIATEAVYTIDPTTLVATQQYVYPTTFDFGGLDFDQTNGKLYGLTDTAPAGQVPGLYEINVAAQTTAFRAPYPAGETDIDGLAVHNGLAYYVTDGPNTAQPFFYIYNAVTGVQVGTLPSPFTGSGTFSAATWAEIPEPAAVTLALFACAGLARRRVA